MSPRMLDAWQIDPKIAFLSADHPLPIAVRPGSESSRRRLPFNVKTLRAELRRLDIGAIDIRRRGLAGDVDDPAPATGAGGARAGRPWCSTRVVDKPWSFVCTDMTSP